MKYRTLIIVALLAIVGMTVVSTTAGAVTVEVNATSYSATEIVTMGNCMVRGSDGTLYIVTCTGDTYSYKPNLMYSTDGGINWAPAPLVGTNSAAGSVPSIVVDTNRKVTMIYRVSYERYANYTIGGSWSTVINVSDSEPLANSIPRGVIDGNNRIWIAFENQTALCVYYNDGGAWNISLLIDSGYPGTENIFSQLSVDANNNIHLAYSNTSGSTDKSIHYRYFNGTAWGSDEIVATQTTSSTIRYVIGVVTNDTNVPFVLWAGRNFGGINPSITNYHASVKIGGSWSAVVHVTDQNSATKQYGSVSADESGKFYVVMASTGHGVYTSAVDIFYRIYYTNGTVSNDFMIADDGKNYDVPYALSNSNGVPYSGVAVTYHNTTGNGNVYFYKSDDFYIDPPVVDFTSDSISGVVPFTVQFTDESTNTPTSWAWNFGDGTNSTSQNPSHTYTIAGTYTVTLTSSNPIGSDSEQKVNYITVYPELPPVANFAVSNATPREYQTVTFTYSGTGGAVDTYSWTFGDGGVGDNQPGQSHAYSNSGTYTVTVTVSNTGGSSSHSESVTVSEFASAAGIPTVGASWRDYWHPPDDSNYDKLFAALTNGSTNISDSTNYTVFTPNARGGSDIIEILANATIAGKINPTNPVAIFVFILFGFVEVILYRRTNSVIVPCGLYLMLYGLLYSYIPIEFQQPALGITILVVAALGYGLYKNFTKTT